MLYLCEVRECFVKSGTGALLRTNNSKLEPDAIFELEFFKNFFDYFGIQHEEAKGEAHKILRAKKQEVKNFLKRETGKHIP
jgi:hypothetical protein